MCGIVGYLGNKEKKSIILNGLKELEYRGYDSAGFAVMKNGQIECFKAVGKLENLANKTKDFLSDEFGVVIGHTRWATHGKPTEINAHPHLGEYSFVISKVAKAPFSLEIVILYASNGVLAVLLFSSNK